MHLIGSMGYGYPEMEPRQNVSHIASTTHFILLTHTNNSTMHPSCHHLGRLVPPCLQLSLPKIYNPNTHLLACRPLSPCTQPLPRSIFQAGRFRNLPRPLRDRRHWFLPRTFLADRGGIVSCWPEQYNDSFARATGRCEGQPRSN
jgi:hypothetical protein